MAEGVFTGLKVIEMGSGAAGPVATRYLAEQGATVIKIESSKRPDFLRVLWLTPDSKRVLTGCKVEPSLADSAAGGGPGESGP